MPSDSETNSLPTQLQELLEQELHADEQLIWCGQPVAPEGMSCLIGYAAMHSVLPIFVGLVCLNIFFGVPLLMTLIVSTFFVLIGWLFAYELSSLRRESQNTIYAITDRRAIILIKKIRSAKITSYKPEDIYLLYRNDSNISFGKYRSVGFMDVPTPRKVELLLKDLAAKAPKAESLPLDQLDDLPILHFLGKVPREIPLVLRLYLRQYSVDTEWAFWGLCIIGFVLAIMSPPFIISNPSTTTVKLVWIGLASPFLIIGIWMVIKAWYIDGPKMIHMLQHGIATKALHLTTFLTGETVSDDKNVMEMQIDFEYQVDGQRYKVSTTGYDLSRLTDAPSKVVFYDPMEPQRAMLLDKFPRGIRFDELTGRFSTNPLNCLPAFLAAAFVCAEIAVIVALALGVDLLLIGL